MILLRDTDDEESLRSSFRELFAKNAGVGPIHDQAATAPCGANSPRLAH